MDRSMGGMLPHSLSLWTRYQHQIVLVQLQQGGTPAGNDRGQSVSVIHCAVSYIGKRGHLPRGSCNH